MSTSNVTIWDEFLAMPSKFKYYYSAIDRNLNTTTLKPARSTVRSGLPAVSNSTETFRSTELSTCIVDSLCRPEAANPKGQHLRNLLSTLFGHRPRVLSSGSTDRKSPSAWLSHSIYRMDELYASLTARTTDITILATSWCIIIVVIL